MIAGFNIQTIDDVDIRDKHILLKIDWNILNLHDGVSLLDTRKLDDTIPTLKYLLERNNRLICVSHISKTKGRDPKRSIKPVVEYVKTLLPDYSFVVIDDFLDESQADRIKNQQQNEIIVLENIRYYPEEKQNDPEFAKKLSDLAEIYVNDAFAAGHRAHASVVGPVQYLPSYAGFSLKKEVESISQAIQSPQPPLTVIIGGAKISTKIELVKKVMSRADYVILGGALANTFIKAQENEVGKSLYEPDQIDTANELLGANPEYKAQIVLPVDACVGSIDDESLEPQIVPIGQVPSDMSILDIGPESVKVNTELIMKSKTVVWNGPVGFFEREAFKKGTDAIFTAMTQNTEATTILGGGDTLTAIKNSSGKENITHISIGGGAMLTLIEKGTMPVLEALRSATNSKQ